LNVHLSQAKIIVLTGAGFGALGRFAPIGTGRCGEILIYVPSRQASTVIRCCRLARNGTNIV